MGIRGLQSFMKREVPNGYEEISIKEICENYQRQLKGQKPTIVIDASGLNFITNYRNTLYGGREHEDFLLFDKFLKQLSEYADLVFYREGPMIKEKHGTHQNRKDEQYQEKLRVFDWVQQGMSVQYIEELAKLKQHNNLTHSRVGKVVQKKYGKVIKSITSECDAEIVKYINEHEHAIAVLSDDSDFLIYGGNFRFFSLDGFKIRQDMGDHELKMMKTFEYNRQALRRYMGLDDRQMVIFSTLCGNDVAKHGRRFDFKTIGSHIRTRYPSTKSENEIIRLVSIMETIPIETVQASFNLYNTNIQPTKHLDPVLKYFVENYLSFCYKIYQRLPVSINCRGYDYRSDDFPDMFQINLMTRRQLAGIIFFHDRHDDYSLVISGKENHEAQRALLRYDGKYPENVDIPPIEELVNREEYPEHDEIRFWLLNWIIMKTEDEDLLKIDEMPKDFLKEMVNLNFMLSNGIVTSNEYRILLLSLKRSKKMIEQGIKIEYDEYPTHIDPRAFSLSLIFNETMVTIEYIFEVLGLKQMLNDSFYYDGVLFHQLFAQYDGKLSAEELQIHEIK